MSRGYFRQNIWRRRDDAPFVDRLQAISSYSHPDETPDPVCIPGDAEIPQAYCANCGLLLTGPYDIDMADGTPIERLWCARCERSVEITYDV